MSEYKTEKEMEDARKASQSLNPNKDTRSEREKRAYNEQQALNRQNNETKKQFARYRSVLDEKDMPKTLGGFKRSKNSNSDNFKKTQRKYREEMKKIRSR